MTFENFHAAFYGLWRQKRGQRLMLMCSDFPGTAPHSPIQLLNLLVNLIECVDAWPSRSHISVYLLFNYLTYQSSLWLDQGSVLAVHFVVQATGVAQIVSRSIASPQWRRCGATIHTLASLCKNYTKLVDGVRKTKIALIFLTICYNKYSLNGELHILLCSKLGL